MVNEPTTLPAFPPPVKLRLALRPGGAAARVAPVRRRAFVVWGLLLAVATLARARLTPDLDKSLADARYVYIQSERKDGSFGKPAEIWFFVDGETLYVGTRPTSWRVKRIKAGRPRARIAIGSPTGSAFEATGAVVKNAAIEAKLMEAFAKKYPEGWPRHADAFREGFRSGDRVLVAYTPR